MVYCHSDSLRICLLDFFTSMSCWRPLHSIWFLTSAVLVKTNFSVLVWLLKIQAHSLLHTLTILSLIPEVALTCTTLSLNSKFLHPLGSLYKCYAKSWIMKSAADSRTTTLSTVFLNELESVIYLTIWLFHEKDKTIIALNVVKIAARNEKA